MSSSRGIKMTVLLASLVLVVFALLTISSPDPGGGDAPDLLKTQGMGGGQNLTGEDAQFRSWLFGAYENVTALVEKIKGAGMSMDMVQAQDYDRQLQQLAGTYMNELDNMTVSSALTDIRSEFRSALEDHQRAAMLGEKGAASMDMNAIGEAMDCFQQATAHAGRALSSADGTA